MPPFLRFLEKNPPIIFFIFIIAFMIFVFVMILRQKQKEKIALKNLISNLNGCVSKNPFIPKFIGTYQAISYSVVLSSGKEDTPNYLYIAFLKKPTFALKITKENLFTEIAQKIKSSCEIKISNTEFDNKYFIKTDQKERTITYLNNPAVKQVINELFQQGFDQISLDKEKILLQKPNYDLKSDITPAKITKILEYLSILSQGI